MAGFIQTWWDMTGINHSFDLLQECTLLRQELHRIPEVGFCEHKTSEYVRNYLLRLNPDSIESIAGTGIKAVFCSTDANTKMLLPQSLLEQIWMDWA